MQINFRKMTPEDASAVEIVEKSCFDMPWSRQSFWQEASNDKAYYLLALDGVESIHQLKVWAITSKNIHLTVHLFAPKVDRNQLHRAAIEMLLHEHGIAEVTLQIEDDAEMNCQHTHQHVEDEQHTHSHQH